MKWRVSNWSSKIVGDRIFGWCDTIDEGEGAFGLPMAGSQVHLLPSHGDITARP